MPTVYTIEILNHLVDGYDEAQRKVIGAEKWLKTCSDAVREAWDEVERQRDPNGTLAATGQRVVATKRDRMNADRRVREKTMERHNAESERNVAREREQQAMRTLCDAVLLASQQGKS